MTSRLKRKRRTKVEVEAVREAAREELAAGYPMTLRQVHYRLVSRDDIIHPNTVSAYDTLSGWLRDDRLEGVIPWEWMEDRLRQATTWAMWDEPAEFLHSVRDRYHRNVWQDQPHYVEVWCEKDALSGIFSNVVSLYGVALNVGRGYDGWSSIKRAADRYQERHFEGMESTVLYFGDFDPSGEDMHRSLQERFATLGVYPEIPKVALTHEDARVLPGDVVKADDSRAPAFVAKYGSLAVELDALPVDELRRRIRTEIEERLDMAALAENNLIEQEQQRTLREGIDRIFGDSGQPAKAPADRGGARDPRRPGAVKKGEVVPSEVTSFELQSPDRSELFLFTELLIRRFLGNWAYYLVPAAMPLSVRVPRKWIHCPPVTCRLTRRILAMVRPL